MAIPLRALIGLILAALFWQSAFAQGVTVIRAARWLDVAGGEVRSPATVVIQGSMIQSVATRDVPAGSTIIDLVGYGMSPLDAIRSATTRAADLLGVEDRGVLAAGKLADLIAVPDNPLSNIRVLEQVMFVMKGGVVVRRPHAQ